MKVISHENTVKYKCICLIFLVKTTVLFTVYCLVSPKQFDKLKTEENGKRYSKELNVAELCITMDYCVTVVKAVVLNKIINYRPPPMSGP